MDEDKRTAKGYPFFEVLSALQKEIRRGKEENALFWALELESFNSKALWNRLRVIASEDIGIADNSISILMDSLATSYDSKKSLIFLSHAILALCRSKKSRIVDHFVIVGKETHKTGNPKIPDYALDIHTGRGKLLGRGNNHWRTEGCKLMNESKETEDIYKERADKIA